MYSITVTIGTSINGIPMSDGLAWEFEQDVEALLTYDRQAGDSIEQHIGVGSWNGVSERSVKTTLLSLNALSEDALGSIRDGLRQLAYSYQQDSIALTIGQSELIEP